MPSPTPSLLLLAATGCCYWQSCLELITCLHSPKRTGCPPRAGECATTLGSPTWGVTALPTSLGPTPAPPPPTIHAHTMLSTSTAGRLHPPHAACVLAMATNRYAYRIAPRGCPSTRAEWMARQGRDRRYTGKLDLSLGVGVDRRCTDKLGCDSCGAVGVRCSSRSSCLGRM